MKIEKLVFLDPILVRRRVSGAIESKEESEVEDDNISIKYYVQNTLITSIDEFTAMDVWMYDL